MRDVSAKGNQRRFFGLGLSIRADGVLSTKMHESMDLGIPEEEIKSSALNALDWICLEDHQMQVDDILFGFQRSQSRDVNLGNISCQPQSRQIHFIKKLPVILNLKRQELGNLDSFPPEILLIVNVPVTCLVSYTKQDLEEPSLPGHTGSVCLTPESGYLMPKDRRK